MYPTLVIVPKLGIHASGGPDGWLDGQDLEQLASQGSVAYDREI
jgi:hypothetical protein